MLTRVTLMKLFQFFFFFYFLTHGMGKHLCHLNKVVSVLFFFDFLTHGMGKQPPSWAIMLAWCLAQRRLLSNGVGIRQLQCWKRVLMLMVILITRGYDGYAGRVVICGEQHVPTLSSLVRAGGKIIYQLWEVVFYFPATMMLQSWPFFFHTHHRHSSSSILSVIFIYLFY